MFDNNHYLRDTYDSLCRLIESEPGLENLRRNYTYKFYNKVKLLIDELTSKEKSLLYADTSIGDFIYEVYTDDPPPIENPAQVELFDNKHL